jgi:hypothetical protein
MEVIVLAKRPKSDRSRKKATTKKPPERWLTTPGGRRFRLKPVGEEEPEGLALGPRATQAHRRRRRD